MQSNNPMQWGKMSTEKAKFGYQNAETICQRLNEVMVDALGIAQKVTLTQDGQGKHFLKVDLGKHSPTNPRPMQADFMGLPIRYTHSE